MRTTNEPTEAPLDLSQPKAQPAPKPDTYTQVAPGIVKNDRTGALSTNRQFNPWTNRWLP